MLPSPPWSAGRPRCMMAATTASWSARSSGSATRAARPGRWSTTAAATAGWQRTEPVTADSGGEMVLAEGNRPPGHGGLSRWPILPGCSGVVLAYLPVSFGPPAWQEHAREGAIEVPAGCELVIVEGVGAARRDLTHLVDTVLWVQSDMAEAERRGIARDGGDEAAGSFWHLWMGEGLPFIVGQGPWERAAVVVAGTPQLAHDPLRQVVIAPPVTKPRSTA